MPKSHYVFRYRICNWREYNRALINRGRLTVWFDEHAIAAWRNTEPRQGPGAPRLYADLAIECALVFKAVYHLSLRAAQGFLSSVMELLKLTLPVPDYSTVSRRQGALSVRLALTPQSNPRHVVIDATGLKVYGAGEWYVWKHRVGRRRTWRKLHLGIDANTKEILAVEPTESRVHDSQRLPSLLAQVAAPLGQVSGDGAYDTRACYEAVLQRGAVPTLVPRRTAHPWATPTPLSGVEFRVARHEQERGPGMARPARCRAYWDIATYSRRPEGTGVLPAGSVSMDQGCDYAYAPLEQTPSDGVGVVESRAGIGPLVCTQCCESHVGTRAGAET